MAHPDFPDKKNSPTFIRTEQNEQIEITPRLSKTTGSTRGSWRILGRNENLGSSADRRPGNQTREKHAYLDFILDLHPRICKQCLAPFSSFLFIFLDPSTSKFPRGICKEDITTSERAFFSPPLSIIPFSFFFLILSLFYFSVQQQHFYLFSNKS